jgi:hypothetical protein
METNLTMRCIEWASLFGLWLGACSDTVNNLGRVEATGGTNPGTGGADVGLAGGGASGGGSMAGTAAELGSGGALTGGAPASAGSGGATACPVGLPASTSSCSSEGLSCYYGGCSGAASYCSATASCQSGSWYIGYTDCMCPGSGGASSAGGAGTAGSLAGGGVGGAGGCTRVSADDAHCVSLGYPPYAYFCRVPATRPDPTCVIYNGIDSGDYYCCP